MQKIGRRVIIVLKQHCPPTIQLFDSNHDHKCQSKDEHDKYLCAWVICFPII
jgi:hypothetical protein